jgi:hypothetical protein
VVQAEQGAKEAREYLHGAAKNIKLSMASTSEQTALTNEQWVGKKGTIHIPRKVASKSNPDISIVPVISYASAPGLSSQDSDMQHVMFEIVTSTVLNDKLESKGMLGQDVVKLKSVQLGSVTL